MLKKKKYPSFWWGCDRYVTFSRYIHGYAFGFYDGKYVKAMKYSVVLRNDWSSDIFVLPSNEVKGYSRSCDTFKAL